MLKRELEAANKKLRAENKGLREDVEGLRAEFADIREELDNRPEPETDQGDWIPKPGDWPPVDYQAAPIRDEYYEPRRGCGPIVIVVLFVVLMAASIGGTVWFMSQRTGDDAAPDGGPVPTELVQEIEGALSGPEAEKHALYLSKVCRGVAGRLADGFARESPVIDQRQEAADLFGIVGQFATSVKGVNEYRRLPAVIESVMTDVFGDELEGGPIAAGEQLELVDAWNDLADAFAEVAR